MSKDRETGKDGRYRAKREDTLVKTITRTPYGSFMYGPLRTGMGVVNCYNTLNREVSFLLESPSSFFKPDWKTFPFLFSQDGEALPLSCREKSYFTQSEIFLDQSCPPGICVQLNSINTYNSGDRERFSYRPDKGAFCRKLKGQARP